MIEKVIETIKKYNLIEDGDKIILAVSGGPDSISMLDILYKIQQNEKIDFKTASNLLLGDISAYLNKNETEIIKTSLSKEKFIEFSDLFESCNNDCNAWGYGAADKEGNSINKKARSGSVLLAFLFPVFVRGNAELLFKCILKVWLAGEE